MTPTVHKIAISALLTLALGVTAVPKAFAAEYFTAEEIEQIREAQEIGRRIPVFLKIAEVRLVRLGLIQGDEEIEEEGGDGNAISRGIIRILSPDAAKELERIDKERAEFDNDLSAFSRSDLLRGYYQALEEAMDNIDDAYERGRGDVRESLEILLAFTRDTIPALGEFAPENGAEEVALEDALEIAELAQDGATEALNVVPRTERR